jgi:hypothetical protein
MLRYQQVLYFKEYGPWLCYPLSPVSQLNVCARGACGTGILGWQPPAVRGKPLGVCPESISQHSPSNGLVGWQSHLTGVCGWHSPTWGTCGGLGAALALTRNSSCGPRATWGGCCLGEINLLNKQGLISYIA